MIRHGSNHSVTTKIKPDHPGPHEFQETIEYGFRHTLTPERFLPLSRRKIEDGYTAPLRRRIPASYSRKRQLQLSLTGYKLLPSKNGRFHMKTPSTGRILPPKRPTAANRYWPGLGQLLVLRGPTFKPGRFESSSI